MLILFYELEENTTNVHNSIIMIFQVSHSVLQAMSLFFPIVSPNYDIFPDYDIFANMTVILGAWQV